MKKLSLILCCLLGLVSIAGNAKQLDVERIFDSPSLTGASVKGLQISPDGTRVTFLRGKDSDYEKLDLWEYDIASGVTKMLFNSDDLHSGEEQLSDEEKARRERLRLRGSGIVSYHWSNDSKALLFPLAGDIYYYKVGEAKARKLVETPEFETDERFSPKNQYISYVREQNLFIMHIASAKETQLTFDGSGHIKNAMAEFVAQEEMGRMTGYWWSKDESKIAFTRVDESGVEKVTRSEIYADKIKTVTQRYPFAGKPNVNVQLGIIQLTDKKVQWIDLGKNKDIYLPRVNWSRDSNILSYQWQSRDQKLLKLNTYNWQSKKITTLITEKSDTWINLHDDLHFLKDGKRFIWASERDGFKHLYLYKNSGELIQQLTKGDWVVTELENVDEERQQIYFSSTQESPIERHLYQVFFNGDAPKKT